MSNREISRERSEEDRGTAAASQANEATARNEGNNIYVSNLAPTTDDE